MRDSFENKLDEWLLVIVLIALFWWMFAIGLIYFCVKWIWNHKYTFIKDLKLNWKQFRCNHKNNTLWIDPNYSDIRIRTCHDCGADYGDKMTATERARFMSSMRRSSLGF